MRKAILAVTALACLALVMTVASGQAPAQPKNLLSMFHVGQRVGVHVAPNGLCQIIVHNETTPTSGQKSELATVIEVGADYIALRDAAATSESRVPIYAILSVLSDAKPQ